MSKPTIAQKRQRAREIREFLLGLPLAAHSPMIDYDALVKELSFFEGLIMRLWAFIDKLKKFSPLERLQWMVDAFANPTSSSDGKSANSNNEIYDSTQDIPEYQPEQVNVKRPSKAKAKANPKRKQIITTP